MKTTTIAKRLRYAKNTHQVGQVLKGGPKVSRVDADRRTVYLVDGRSFQFGDPQIDPRISKTYCEALANGIPFNPNLTEKGGRGKVAAPEAPPEGYLESRTTSNRGVRQGVIRYPHYRLGEAM